MFHPGSFVPPLPIFLLFLEQNLLSVLMPSMYVHQLSGIPLDLVVAHCYLGHFKKITHNNGLPFVTPKSFLYSNNI